MPDATEAEVSTSVETAPAAETTPQAEFDRGALEATVASKMADVFKDNDDTLNDDPPAEETPATSVETEAEEKTEATQTPPTVAADKAGQDKPTPGTVNPATAPLVPDAYRRSLKAYQWTDAEIDAAAKAHPEQFLATAAKLHNTRIEETRQWSDLGRKLKEQQAEAAKKAEATNPAEIKRIDVAALRKQYGDEPFIAALEQFNQLHDQFEKVNAFVEQSQRRQQQAELETLSKQIDGFFTDKAMEPYADMYGKAGTTLTEQHLTSRQKVLDTADLLIGGARQMGRSMTLEEALTLAHDSVSGPVKATAARKEIVQAVKTRNNAISLKPGGKTTAASPGDRKALQAKVKAGLAAAFSA